MLFNRGIDTVKITALSNHKPGILNNYIIMIIIPLILYFTADIYEEVVPEIEEQGLDCECMGGGRIEHDSHKKKLSVFGYSQVHNFTNYKYFCIYTVKPFLCNLPREQ